MKYGDPHEQSDSDFTCEPHVLWINFLYDRFKSDRLHSLEYITLYSHLFEAACRPLKISTSWKAREARFDLVTFGLRIYKELERRKHQRTYFVLRNIFLVSLNWFAQRPMYIIHLI